MTKTENLIPGLHYHIYNIGNNRESLFIQNKNYYYFLRLYGKYIQEIAETYSYSLLKNHFHFIIKIRDESELTGNFIIDHKNLSLPFSNFFNTYSKSINKMYNRTGSLFQERFRRKIIISKKSLKTMIFNSHFDPQRHKLISDFRDYEHSSYNSILSGKKTRLAREEVLKIFGGLNSFIEFHHEMSRIIINKKSRC